MPVPTYDQFLDPILRYLDAHPNGAPAREVHHAVSVTLGLTDSDRQELLPSGVQPVYTSAFTMQAEEFARSVERVVLVNGARLAELMIDHEVGVTLRPLKVPKLDGDYFEE